MNKCVNVTDVVTLKHLESDIVEIIMEDRNNHNMFSPELIKGLTIAFQSLPATTKVVIIQGYENYFCSGGTEEQLLSIFEGKKTYRDDNFYRLLLDCEIPTIAAMQGHALGGGLVFGCYADFLILSEESIYIANFMNFGFTPGMGATYIIPKKFGETLGNEMLFSAKDYQGSELKERYIQLPVVKRNEIFGKAMILAKEIARKPLDSLKLLKSNQVASTKKELSMVVEREISMHEISFKKPEVRDKIIKHFNKQSKS